MDKKRSHTGRDYDMYGEKRRERCSESAFPNIGRSYLKFFAASACGIVTTLVICSSQYVNRTHVYVHIHTLHTSINVQNV